MCASAWSRLTGYPCKTRWWFGTREAHPTKHFRRGGRAGIVPAGPGDGRRAEVPAPAEAGGHPQEKTWREELAVLSPSVRVDDDERGADYSGLFWSAIRALFAADAADEAGPDRRQRESHRSARRDSETFYPRPRPQRVAHPAGNATDPDSGNSMGRGSQRAAHSAESNSRGNHGTHTGGIFPQRK